MPSPRSATRPGGNGFGSFACHELASCVPSHRHTTPSLSTSADVNFVVAATDRADVNGTVAADARAKGILVNVADAPDLGTCTIPALHRVGEIIVAVSTGGVPSAAMRLRDEMARIVDERHGRAVSELIELRRSLLDRGERGRWHDASAELVGPDFLADVGSGRFSERLGQWR